MSRKKISILTKGNENNLRLGKMPIEKILVCYIQLEHLNEEFNRCFSKWVLTCFYIFHIPILIVGYAFLIKFHNDVTIYFILVTGFAVLSSLGIAISFPFASSLYYESMKLKHYLLFNTEQNAWNQKRIQAFIPLKIAVRNFTIVQKHTGLVTLGFIFYFSLRITILVK